MIIDKILVFIGKRKRPAMDKTLEQRFLKKFKATCKTFIQSELKQQERSEMHHRSVTPEPFHCQIRFGNPKHSSWLTIYL